MSQEVSPFTGFVEFAPSFQQREKIQHVLFDFDGTLSLVREGWPQVMLPMFVEMLPKRSDDTQEDLERMLLDDIMKLNGKQTIYQMIQLAERIRERGGHPKDPLWYKHEYLRRLDQRIAERKQAIREGRLTQDEVLVHGARHLLERLAEKGLPIYLASGTDEPFVKEEAAILGIEDFFEGHIYGAQDDYKAFSKKMVIERILSDHQIPGESLLSFGDGYVEIENTKEVGGLAIAVASDEANNGSGQIDAWKHQRLKGVGADVIIA
ncbi:MAG TPA: haloacid dehalogenase, partial [Verrucomicrobiales bacterium]|nr:haloacid dehalogenase [Verrucomicrobiales bacterium]